MQTKTLRPSPTALLNPRLDPNFKAIFTQETKESDEALQSFLSSILGRKITNIKLTSNEPPVDTPDLLQMSFDVSVTFEDGEKACIEMQGRNHKYSYSARSEIQVARLLNNNVKKGSEWNTEKVYQISVLNFHIRKDDNKQLSWYTMQDENGYELNGLMNVIFIDLIEIKKLFGTPVDELTALQKWGLYLSYADDESKAEYIADLVKSEKGIMEADRIIGRMSEEESNWFRQNSIDTAMRDYNTEINNYRKEGIEIGEQKKAIETATNFLKEKIPVETIAKCTGLSLEKVKELAAEINN